MAEGVLRELNISRQQPQVYIEHLKARRKLMDSHGLIHRPDNPVALQTNEGYAAIDEAIRFLEGQLGQSYPELTMSHGMTRACQDLIDVNGPPGVVGHTGADGSTLMDRLSRYGQIQLTAGENIDFGNTDPVTIVLQLITDDGGTTSNDDTRVTKFPKLADLRTLLSVPNRGHRTNIYNPQFKVVGIALGPHKVYGHSCCMDFAGGFIESTPPPENFNSRSIPPPPRYSMPPLSNENSGPPPLPPKPGVKKAPAPITQPDQLPTLQPSAKKSQNFPNNPPHLPPIPPGSRKSMISPNAAPQQNPPQPGLKKAMPGMTPTPMQSLPPGAKKAVMLTPGQAHNAPPGRRQSAPPPPAPGKVATGPVKIAEFAIGANPFAAGNEPLIEMDQSQEGLISFKPKIGKSEVTIVVTVIGGSMIKFDTSFMIGAVKCQSCQTFQLPNSISPSNVKFDGNKIIVLQ